MKSALKYIVTRILASRAKKYLKQNKVKTIGVTGSVGKTSTKNAINTILKSKFKVNASQKGFNTELGICLTILQEEKSGFSSIKEWAKIIHRAFYKPLEPYDVLVLEMGADHPGDIKKLVNIAEPTIGVVTNVNPVHLGEGQFKDLDEIAKEKGSLIRNMKSGDIAVLNFDDERVRTMSTLAKKVGYGVSPEANVRITDLKMTSKFLEFHIAAGKQTQNFTINALGDFQVYVLAPAIAVALEMGMTLKECATALKEYRVPPGRMNPIRGINDCDIIDSSYNASPVSVHKALEIVAALPAGRKIAALGTMNELGEFTKEAHIEIGTAAAKVANILVLVGQEANTMKQAAIEAGMDSGAIYTFLDSEEAGHFLKGILTAKDLVLVKGSQNLVRMEKLVKIIMAEPEKADELLCRQEKEWGEI